jgi:hypothetical protein
MHGWVVPGSSGSGAPLAPNERRQPGAPASAGQLAQQPRAA